MLKLWWCSILQANLCLKVTRKSVRNMWEMPPGHDYLLWNALDQYNNIKMLRWQWELGSIKFKHAHGKICQHHHLSSDYKQDLSESAVLDKAQFTCARGKSANQQLKESQVHEPCFCIFVLHVSSISKRSKIRRACSLGCCLIYGLSVLLTCTHKERLLEKRVRRLTWFCLCFQM